MKRFITLRPFAALALVLATACGDGGTDPPKAGPPALLQKTGGDAQTGGAGTVLADSLSVRVLDASGNAVPGVAVTFGGASQVSNGTVVTSAQGYARTSVTLRGWPGVDTIYAGVPGLAQVKFSVTVTAGAVANIVRVEGDAQTSSVGRPVFVSPLVRLEDSFGNPVGGVTVTFTPGPGSGTVTGGTQVSDPLGRARVGSWVLGQEGTNRLDVTVPGGPTVSFGATAIGACTTAAYTLFATVESQLNLGCNVEARVAQPYSITFATSQGVDFSVASKAFMPSVGFMDANGRVVAWNQMMSLDSSFLRVYAPAGSYGIAAAMASPTSGGAYRLRSSAAAGAVCSLALVIPGVTFQGAVETLGCGPELQNRYKVVVRTGQLRVTVSSAAFNPQVVITNQHGHPAASASGTGPGTTAQATAVLMPFEFYIIDVTPQAGATGAYTMTVEHL